MAVGLQVCNKALVGLASLESLGPKARLLFPSLLGSVSEAHFPGLRKANQDMAGVLGMRARESASISARIASFSRVATFD